MFYIKTINRIKQIENTHLTWIRNIQTELIRKKNIYEHEFDEINGKLEILKDKYKKLHNGMVGLSDEIGDIWTNYIKKTPKTKKKEK